MQIAKRPLTWFAVETKWIVLPLMALLLVLTSCASRTAPSAVSSLCAHPFLLVSEPSFVALTEREQATVLLYRQSWLDECLRVP